MVIPSYGQDAAPDKPKTLTTAELPEDAVPMALITRGGPNFPSWLPGELGFSAGLYFTGMPPSLPLYLEAYWVTSREVMWKGTPFLIAYRCDSTPRVISYALQDQDRRPFDHLRFHEVLIRSAAITSFTPQPELSKAKLLAMIAELSKRGSVGDVPSALRNIKQAGLSMVMYCNDTDDVMPDAHSASQAVVAMMPYVKTRTPFQSLNPNGGQILFNVKLAGVSIESITSPATVPVFYDSLPWPDGGRPVAFADGHGRYVSASEWPPVQAELKRKFKRAPKPKPIGKATG